MKANEIMIGDLLRVTKDVCIKKGTIVRVRAIDADDSLPQKGLKCAVRCQPIDDIYGMNIGGVWLNFLEPIPLTAEILEKIGLCKITLDGEKGSKQDYYIDTHFVGCYNMDALTRVHASPIVYDIKQKWLFVDDKKLCRIELMCPYVHTLQHALRLCGIDKTFEL